MALKQFLSLGVFAIALTAQANDVTPRFVQPNAPELTLTTVATQQLTQEQTFDGVLEAINQSTVSAQTSGRITTINVDVGDEVNKGDLIVAITDTEQQARVNSAQARYDEALAQYRRIQKMYQGKLVSKANYDQAEATYKSAEANLKEAQQNLAYTKVYAPYSGIVLSRAVKVGETVGPGSPLMTGLSLEALRVQVSIPQSSISAVRAYQKAYIRLDNGQTLTSTALRIPPSANAQTHTFEVLVNLPTGSFDLYPGTVVKVAFITGERSAVSIAKEWVAHRGEVTGVYVVENDQLSFRLVRLGSLTEDHQYPVLAGLQAGDQIAIDPVTAAIAYKASHTVESPQGE